MQTNEKIIKDVLRWVIMNIDTEQVDIDDIQDLYDRYVTDYNEALNPVTQF